jgi:glycosyltransferase involved in cell wall biosynthesis
MKLGVALNEIAYGATGGLTVVVRELLEAVFAGWPDHEVVLFSTPVNEHLFPAPPRQVHQVVLPRADYFPLVDACAARLGVDVLFCPFPFGAELTFDPARQVVLMPDCQHEFFPDFFAAEELERRRRDFARALAGAGAVATLSDHARECLLKNPAAGGREVLVLNPALRPDASATAPTELPAAERACIPDGPFFVYPANLWPHKNHRRVFRAFEHFVRGTGLQFEFLCTGHPAGWDELAREFPGLPVRHLGYVSPGLLRALMGRAQALAFFPLFEGFGMPLLEAFAGGTPVICSNVASLPEVGGDAVLSCDPTDVEAMSALMARVFADQPLRDRLAARGRQRLARYSWHASAARLVEACARLAAGPRGGADPVADVRRLVGLVRAIQTERDERLAAIRVLDAACGERAKVIDRLAADLSKSQTDFEEIKAHLHQTVGYLRQSQENNRQIHESLERTRDEVKLARDDNATLRATVARLNARLGTPLARTGDFIHRAAHRVSRRFRRFILGAKVGGV